MWPESYSVLLVSYEVLGWQKFPECPHTVDRGTDHWFCPAKAGGWGFSIRVSPPWQLKTHHNMATGSQWKTFQEWKAEVPDLSRPSLRISQHHSHHVLLTWKDSRSNLDSRKVKRVCLLRRKGWSQIAKSSVEWEIWHSHLCKLWGMLGWGECVLCLRRTRIWGKLEKRNELCVSPGLHVEVLTPDTSEWNLIWKYGHCRYN